MCKKCFCSIVPSEILTMLAKKGSLASKETLNDIFRIQQKRNTVLNEVYSNEFIAGAAQRLIYDSMNSKKQRLRLVRTEKGQASDNHTVNAAFDLSGVVRNYFMKKFDLNSMNGNGLDIISNVHYGNNYTNAFWDGDEVTYGDGESSYLKNFATSIDIVAHELTHGVTQFTSNLDYYSQPGALNEHFSDVFGTIMKIKHKNQTVESANWLIGDEVVGEAFPGMAIRSMKDPGTAYDGDKQPEHMDNYYTGPEDNQGVHINSGVPNKAFYLTAKQIGLEDCEKIWFNTLRTLWRTANFEDAFEMFVINTEKLQNEGQVSNQAKHVIVNSFNSVGIYNRKIIS